MLTKRSIAITGHTTSISLESVFWDEIERQANLYGMPWQKYTRYLIRDADENINRSAFIRKKVLLHLKEELSKAKKDAREAWWSVSLSNQTREIGTRSAIIYAGRETDNDLIIDDESVSRRHFMLCWDGEKWWAVDLNSKNGTYLAGKAIQADIVHEGTPLVAGEAKITLMG